MTDTATLVSIVLPVYNGARYLAESIQSCLDQTYANWELIIVDDASTDDTPAIIAGFAARDSRVRSLRHETNKRLPATLNDGFAQARGAYLTWTSDDNRYRPEALATLVRTLDAKPDAAFVYAGYDVIDDDGRYVQTNHAQPPARFIQGYDAVPCFLYRRAVYEELGGYADDLFLAEDYEYWLRIYATRHTMLPLPDTLYEYRRHARSLTDEYRGRTFAAAERALLRNLPRLAWAGRSARGAAYLHLASLATWQGERRRAANYSLHAAYLLPLRFAGQLLAFTAKRLRGRGASGSSRHAD
ncbi:MAG TPA: glycosyltransferase [Ktedonobacterales bacterium]|nr:glycosyltransferase [Ktedonobacterales bacterium]